MTWKCCIWGIQCPTPLDCLVTESLDVTAEHVSKFWQCQTWHTSNSILEWSEVHLKDGCSCNSEHGPVWSLTHIQHGFSEYLDREMISTHHFGFVWLVGQWRVYHSCNIWRQTHQHLSLSILPLSRPIMHIKAFSLSLLLFMVWTKMIVCYVSLIPFFFPLVCLGRLWAASDRNPWPKQT